MAEKPEDQISREEKIAKAKELYGLGCRNYYVKKYSDAADDLSEASKLLGEEYGVDGDELGEVYLLYAKALIAIGQEENKLIEVPENDGEDEDDDEPEVEEPVEGTMSKLLFQFGFDYFFLQFLQMKKLKQTEHKTEKLKHQTVTQKSHKQVHQEVTITKAPMTLQTTTTQKMLMTVVTWKPHGKFCSTPLQSLNAREHQN